MLVYLALILGLLVLIYAFLSYTGSAMLAGVPPVLHRKGDPLWLAGLILIALALLLGWVGYSFGMDVRLARILLGVIGLVLLVLAWPRTAQPA